ncbi:hypothetical protein BDN67DRAFT_965909, partial [Paxillus ammoniavirescens]
TSATNSKHFVRGEGKGDNANTGHARSCARRKHGDQLMHFLVWRTMTITLREVTQCRRSS